MSDSVLMQYLGFESKHEGREYAFQVRYTAEDIRDFMVVVATEMFASRRVSYQDAPDLCSMRLKRELIANANLPSGTNFAITDSELEDYRSGHTHKAPKGFHPMRPRGSN